MSEDQDLLLTLEGGIALITLNRQKALNALTSAMVVQLSSWLHAFATDPVIRAVVIMGAGEKAFCAGGDIRQLYDSREMGPVSTRFFRDEYVLNSQIHHFPKPYIAVLNGITMGGGVGVSAHGSYRIATERTLWAMPETAIGLFPDVGGSYILPRLRGRLGLYLGLTGHRLRAADLCAVGLATHYMPGTSSQDFIDDLTSGCEVDQALTCHTVVAESSEFFSQTALIDKLFSAPTVDLILKDLEAEASPWASATRDGLLTKSPTSLRLTQEAARRGAQLTFKEAMRMEFRIVSHLMQGRDFFEGVRALLVDRDNAPLWSPSDLSLVSDAAIDAYFAPLEQELIL